MKALYDELFKGRPELLNEDSVLSAVKSRLLNSAEDTAQVRESVSDVRMKHMLPAIPTTATSLQIKKEGEFDRLLLLVFSAFLTGQRIPPAFLKSSYFTPKAQLQQIFAEDPRGFWTRIEEPQAKQDIRQVVMQDYRALVNSINQQLLGRYPFEAVYQGVNLAAGQFSRSLDKLQGIVQHARLVPR